MDEDRNLQSQVERAVPLSYRIYAYVIHWLTIVSALAALFTPVFILADPKNNILNPNVIFGAIFDGAGPEKIWELSSTGAFPGAHFYLRHINKADSWAMAFMNFGCGAGFFALVPAVICQIVKERDWFCSFFGILLALLVFLSMTGILSIAG